MSSKDEEVLARYPEEAIDQDNVDYYRGLLSRELRLRCCADCGEWHHPPRAICPACWSTRVESIPVEGRGKVHLLTVLHLGTPTEGVDYAKGHPLATVELEEPRGVRFTATLLGCERGQMQIGLPVELTWIERGGAPFPAFRPTREAR